MESEERIGASSKQVEAETSEAVSAEKTEAENETRETTAERSSRESSRQKGPLDDYDPEIVKRVLEKYWKDFAILPAHAVTIIKAQCEAEMQKDRLIKSRIYVLPAGVAVLLIFDLILYSMGFYERQGDFENFIWLDYLTDCARVLIAVPVCGNVLRKRNFKTSLLDFRCADEDKQSTAAIIGFSIIFPVVSDLPVSVASVLTYCAMNAIAAIFQKIKPEKANLYCLKFFLVSIPLFMAASIVIRHRGAYETLATYGPYIDVTVSCLLLLIDLRSKRINDAFFCYAILLMFHRCCRLLTWAYLACTINQYSLLYFVQDITMLILYVIYFKSFRRMRACDLELEKSKYF